VAWLVALDGDLAGMRFPLEGPCLVGRGPINHVVLDDPRISRQHAKIAPEADGHVVYDLASANGTFINDAPVKRHRLQPDDIVRFGPFRFRFERAQASTGRRRERASGEVRTLVGTEHASIVESVDALADGIATRLTDLEDADRKLRTFYSFLQSIASTLEVEELLDRVGSDLFHVYPAADNVTLYLRADGGERQLSPRRSLARGGQDLPLFALSSQIHDEVVGRGRAILSSPLSQLAVAGPPPAGAKKAKAVRRGSTMHTPIIHRGACQGVIQVRAGAAAGTPFQQSDLDLLTGLAAVVALGLDKARMHAASLHAERLAQDLRLAQEIQKSFLPRQLPSAPGVEFIAEYQPAYSVGGDFYDVFWLSSDRLGVFVGDVAGKGVSAALLMARITSDLRVAALAEPDPARVLERVNRQLLERQQHDIFVTATLLALDLRSKRALLANAGHLAPVVRRACGGPRTERLEGSGTPLGTFEDADYRSFELALDTGDALVLCTDGIVEAPSASGEMFGLERLEASVAAGSPEPRALAARVLTTLRQHTGDAPPHDDLTLLVCGISG
jgi:serine phosphatase RsbU (regulator of sigma subunit)